MAESVRFATLYTEYRCSHVLPYPDALPGTYLYSDGCTVRKHGDGSYSLIFYDSEPLDPHTYADFANHPDSRPQSDSDPLTFADCPP